MFLAGNARRICDFFAVSEVWSIEALRKQAVLRKWGFCHIIQRFCPEKGAHGALKWRLRAMQATC
jgi:hypothetical protein